MSFSSESIISWLLCPKGSTLTSLGPSSSSDGKIKLELAVVNFVVLQCLLNYGLGHSDDNFVQVVVYLLVKTILRYGVHCLHDHLLEDLREDTLFESCE